MYVDVAITDSATTCVHALRSRAARSGAAASKEADAKRLRYPGPDLVPFVIEVLGRLGQEANALLSALAPEDPEERARVLGSARQSLSALLQVQNSELVLSAMR